VVNYLRCFGEHRNSFFDSIHLKPGGKALSDNLRAAIISLARHFDVDNIVEYTGCKRRTVERTLADYRRHGVVASEHMFAHLRGARRNLACRDVRVCL
jgi:hypothetical protein